MQRAALITGSSAGIGLAVAQRLAQEGYALTICGRNPERLGAAREELEAITDVLVLEADLSSAAGVEQMVQAHFAARDRLDVLVNNAGVGLFADVGKKQLRHFELEMNLNLRAAFHTMHLCRDALVAAGRETGKALVVNVGSVVARECPPGLTGYASTKAGLAALSASAHAELSREGVQVAHLGLGLVDTPGTDWNTQKHESGALNAGDVGEAVAFLLRTSPGCFVPDLSMTTFRGSVYHSGANW